MTYMDVKQKVFNRGAPPDKFLDEMVAWGKTAPGSCEEIGQGHQSIHCADCSLDL